MNYEKFLAYQKRAHTTVYDEHPGGFHDSIIAELAQQFLPRLTQNTKDLIIDIGCGPGIFLAAAHELGYENLLGITLSTVDSNQCQQKGFRTMNSNMSDLDLADHSVDVIWCRHALEHSAYPLFTLYEFHRVLNANGRVFIEVPAPDNQRSFMHEYNPNHYSILGERMWAGLFEKAEFDVVEDYVYKIQVPHENSLVDERSFIFVLAKAQEPVAERFMRKYGINIKDKGD